LGSSRFELSGDNKTTGTGQGFNKKLVQVKVFEMTSSEPEKIQRANCWFILKKIRGENPDLWSPCLSFCHLRLASFG